MHFLCMVVYFSALSTDGIIMWIVFSVCAV